MKSIIHGLHKFNQKTIVLMLGLFSASTAQPSLRYPGGNEQLDQRWKWAKEEKEKLNTNGDVWVVYSIRRLMPENSYIGSFGPVSARSKPSLYEVIFGERIISQEPTFSADGKGAMVEKDVGILLRFGKTDHALKQPLEVKVSNLSLAVELHELPLLWLGELTGDDHVETMAAFFDDAQIAKSRKRIIQAVALAGPVRRGFELVSKVVTGEEPDEIRAEAAFWLAEYEEPSVNLLVKIVEEDVSKKVRDRAVYALSRINDDKGKEALIFIVQKAKHSDARRTAMHALAEVVVRKMDLRIRKVVEDAAYNDRDLDVQRNAIHALARMPDAVENLLKVVRTHPNVQIRRHALYALSNLNDPRAHDAIIELVKSY
jgi:hypothetical protein